ncbi:hypothetical protein TBLA_0H01130 [Henningerozyma blattae CBS 6284]|uniref:Uncharacterized protein n=1 Tax=Henningerozyma blattae (strain ATCC 34711 / CBS 6284 / DSM 70876 / NBRC 10599 / NRRL Y-10934 / UCD 77-7) TaxID=1071380 RepID=I2H7P9_HENB6|nr:hypothetical protein TBLA_0H01130 [Tetrapisispora blattae CBS 6284]CCH62401.1 hypothetical protein TBLA_0H01130 [Tetrapisispora blattae CBS 6284]
MANLIELQKNYFLKQLNDIQVPHNVKLLVIDDYVEKFFGFIFANPDELLAHVAAVDRIDSPKRRSQQSLEVIYLVKPTKFNISCIDVDFQGRPAKYKNCHIRFLPGFAGYLVEYFNHKRYISQYMKSLAEFKLAFYPRELQVFQTMDIDRPLQIFFNQNCTDLIERNIERTIQSLLNLCIITGEYPIVRYTLPNENQLAITPAVMLVKKVAVQFQDAIDDYARKNQDFPPQSTRPRATLIITDRTLDLFSPILHDFTYQSMAYDLVSTINLRNDLYTYSAESEKGDLEEKSSKLMDLYDDIWIELKYQHIMDAHEYLQGKVKEIIAKNPLLVDRSNVKNTTDLLSVVAHLKGFDEERRKLVLHQTLIEECLKLNRDRKLAEYSDVEQCLSGFGLDADGNKIKNITETIFPLLISKHPSITDKIRYIIIYALYRGGIIEEDFNKLLSFAGILKTHEHFNNFITLMKNFDKLGFPLVKNQPKDKPFEKIWFNDTITNDSNVYNTSRFIPATGNILSKVIANPLYLSEENFPYVKDKPIELLDEEDLMFAGGGSAATTSSTSLRNQRHKATWTKANSASNPNNQANQTRQRIFYYVMGGLTYGEIKSAYEQSSLKNKDIFIGSDSLITPLMFLQSIEHLNAERESLNIKDDKFEDDKVPEFLYAEMQPVAVPVSHVHLRSQNKPITPGMVSSQNNINRSINRNSNPNSNNISSNNGSSQSESFSGVSSSKENSPDDKKDKKKHHNKLKKILGRKKKDK